MTLLKRSLNWFLVGLLSIGFLLVFITPLLHAETDFKKAVPGRIFRFPRDHFAHPDFKLEWWYYTGNLQTKDGEKFGYQLTFFRLGLKGPDLIRNSRWATHTLYFAHFALTDKTKEDFFYQEKISRGGLEQAGAATGHYRVWIDNWEVKGEDDKHFLTAGDAELGIKLQLTPAKSPVLHGENGFSQKAQEKGPASYYYSVTRLKTKGVIFYQGETYAVNGLSWMDHEFGSNQLAHDQIGWDWFSLQLDNNMEIMLYALRQTSGKKDPASSGTLIFADGRSIHLSNHDFQITVNAHWQSPNSGATYPAGWQIIIPCSDISLEVVPAVNNQELITRESTQVTYWEGSVYVRGEIKQKPVKGQGYAELTGYASDRLKTALK